MIVILLLVLTFFMLIYLFATKDQPFAPVKNTDTKSKQDVINWFAWRGPMFVEDFNGSPFIPLEDAEDEVCAKSRMSPPNAAMFEGFGKMIFTSGGYYEGYWKKGLFHGLGRHKFNINARHTLLSK